MGAFVLALLAAASCGGDDTGPVAGKVGALEVTDAYARGVMDDVAVYFTVKNTGDTDDALVEASAEVAGMATLHETVTEGVNVRMPPVAEIEIPAQEEITLQPGGYHVMLMDLERPLKEGDSIEVRLTFRQAGTATIQVPVVPYAE
ncbi:MAG: hypothetical protein A2148_10650 [Chloroflexi bacterium RBG_16_68_14]|nr:MAG: hypothetical protein A2148_10650 [Chloroflexi bacterium RBG_16_68_14]